MYIYIYNTLFGYIMSIIFYIYIYYLLHLHLDICGIWKTPASGARTSLTAAEPPNPNGASASMWSYASHTAALADTQRLNSDSRHPQRLGWHCWQHQTLGIALSDASKAGAVEAQWKPSGSPMEAASISDLSSLPDQIMSYQKGRWNQIKIAKYKYIQ